MVIIIRDNCVKYNRKFDDLVIMTGVRIISFECDGVMLYHTIQKLHDDTQIDIYCSDCVSYNVESQRELDELYEELLAMPCRSNYMSGPYEQVVCNVERPGKD
jgi:hypothetical protein